MFDEVDFRYRMPDGFESNGFQTKNLRRVGQASGRFGPGHHYQLIQENPA